MEPLRPGLILMNEGGFIMLLLCYSWHLNESAMSPALMGRGSTRYVKQGAEEV